MADLTYQNFDLRIERRSTPPGEAPRYRAAVLASPVGEASGDFALSIPQDATVQAIGRLLFEAVFADETLTALRRSLDRVGRRRGGLRIRLRLSEAPELADLPWEALYDPRRERFLALSNETPVVRYLDLPEAIEPLKTSPPLRILPVMASPRDLPRLDLAGEMAGLRRALADLTDAGLVEIEPQPPTTLAGLRNVLRRQTCHVIHFLGHGDIDPDTGEGFLVMEDRDGNGRPVVGSALAALLGDHRSLRLVVLNACRGAAAATGRPFTSVAGRLVQQTIPAVVAMRTAISDEAATAFAHEFYAALAAGYAVDAAVTEARKALFTEGQTDEWATPVLFLRAADGRIFDLPARKSESEVRANVMVGDGATKKGAFVVRARPAMGGDSIGHYRGGAATLGCLVRDRTEPRRVYILCDSWSLWPATFAARAGDPVVQPALLDGGHPAADVIAVLARRAAIYDDPSAAATNLSVALAEVRNLADVSPELRGRGFLRGVRRARAGQEVFAVGRTNGLVRGTVIRTDGHCELAWPATQVEGALRNTPGPDGNVTIPFDDLIECTAMIDFGDSGTILVDEENYALGVGFAGGAQLSLFHPIQKVLDVLGVDLVTEEVWRTLTAPSPAGEAPYAAFISYAAADRQWVFETLLPQIERAGHRVIIDVRDFPPGASRADAITWAVANSRHTIAVLTPEYVADEWQALEALAARTADPAAWRRKLLPLRLKPCVTPTSIAAIALEVADLTDPYAARYALARLLKALA